MLLTNEYHIRLATYASVSVALTLICVKSLAFIWTDSVSILASLVDSLMDSVTSIVNLFAVRYSLMPADKEHRYGHGKAEPLAGLIQVGFICASAIFLFVRAIERFQNPDELAQMEAGLGIMFFSIFLTALLVIYQRRVIRLTRSTAISADSLHYVTDLLTNVSVVLALFLSLYGWIRADAFVAMGMSVFIFYSALSIGYDSFQQLMDHEISEEEKNKVLEIAQAHPKTLGVHDLRTRRSGRQTFIQMHLELDRNLLLLEAHEIADEVEEAIGHLFPEAEVIVHQDPVSYEPE